MNLVLISADSRSVPNWNTYVCIWTWKNVRIRICFQIDRGLHEPQTEGWHAIRSKLPCRDLQPHSPFSKSVLSTCTQRAEEKKKNMLCGKFDFQLFSVICVCLAQNPITVTIPQGTLQGKEMSLIRTQRIHAYLGIPYAQPPLGTLRFAPPQIDPLPSWDDVRNATEFAKACLQLDKYTQEDMVFMGLITDAPIESSEDCLYLNVFVPYGEWSNSLKLWRNLYKTAVESIYLKLKT